MSFAYSARTVTAERRAFADDLRRDYTSEAVRIAQFEQSARVRNGVVPTFLYPVAPAVPSPANGAAGLFDSNGAAQ